MKFLKKLLPLAAAAALALTGCTLPGERQRIEENFDPEYITEGERLLAQEMERILDDEELLKKYSGKAYERALVYTPDKYKDSIHEIFKRYE